MKSYRYFYVNKMTHTFSDGLTAFGLARILYELLTHQVQDDERDVLIEDHGMYYLLTCTPDLDQETILTHSQNISPLRAVWTAKTADKIPEWIPRFDYEAEKEIASTYYAGLGKGSQLQKPHHHWPIYSAINSKDFSARDTYNRLVKWWETVRSTPEVLLLLFNLFCDPLNDLEKAAQTWKEIRKERAWDIDEATFIQFFNPDRGKGLNSTKPDGVTAKNPEGFWLIEWLKAVGFYEAGITERIGKDRKTLVIAPTRISFEANDKIMPEFLGKVYAHSSQGFDTLAVIYYTQTLLGFFLDRVNPIAEEIGEIIPKKVVSGFDTAFYKNLEAVATMNISFISLPNWVIVRSSDDATVYQEILDDLEKLARHLDRQLDRKNKRIVQSQDDVIGLLRNLRDFVAGGDLTTFLKFSIAYASYYIRMREKDSYVRPLSTELVERIITVMGEKYSRIANREQYPGFHNIAAAIATSTVWAQNEKIKKGKPTYEIRYGLHRDIARQAQTPEKFLKALSEFIRSYNNEAMRAAELEKLPLNHIRLIAPSDIDDVLRMLDEYNGDSQLIAELMLAYGSGFMKFVRPEKTDQE